MNVICTEKAPGAIGPYSQGYSVGGFVFTSGQIPVNPADGTIPEGIVEEGTHAQLLEKQGVYYRLWNQLPAEDEE